MIVIQSTQVKSSQLEQVRSAPTHPHLLFVSEVGFVKFRCTECALRISSSCTCEA